MDVDIILEPDLGPKEITELATAAESYGIRGIWTSNYFAHWDCFLSLATVAQNTTNLKLGALAVSPFEMHPLKIANSLLSLNELSGGRAMIALGAGEGNLDAMALTKPKKQVLAIREAIEIVRKAGRGELNNGDHGYKGEIFNVNFPCAYDWLTQEAPYVYGTAYRHMMMRMEARVADGVYIGCNTPEMIDDAMEQVKVGIERRDDDGSDVRLNAFWAWHIKADKAEAYRESRRELAWRARKLDPEMVRMYASEEETEMVTNNFQKFVDAWFDRSGNIKDIPEELANRLCESFTSTGGLDDLDREIERFSKYGKAGLTEIALRLHDDPMDALKIIGEEVVPKLRDV